MMWQPGSRAQAVGSLEEGGYLTQQGVEVGGGRILEKVMPEGSTERPNWVSSRRKVGKGTLCGYSDNQGLLWKGYFY